ncbi:MAG TPA: transaldolase [Candidatus Limnocylindria bacterium]|nr:transaldolase [Candidatus Limnocylindria bacterium]
MNTLQRLYQEHGQSPWVDFVERHFIESGKLDELIGQGVRGLTSNPTIFAKAIAGGEYDELISRRLEEGASNEAIYEEIVLGDVGDAADHLRRVYDSAGGHDGFASIEVEPALAHDTQATVERARHLWRSLGRPNPMIKIPATEQGLEAISTAISEGINVNVTLVFSIEMYERVARAYIEGLRRRHERGEDVTQVASVASFFVSRVDSNVDKKLDALDDPRAPELRGKAAIANARLAYEAFQRIFGGDEFAELRAAGAHVQRCLWASTSTKDPAYRDVIYVEELIGPETVDTMPLETIEAFMDDGRLAATLDAGYDDARRVFAQLSELGIEMGEVTDELLREGVEKFAASFDELIETIGSKRAVLSRR